MIRHDFKQRLRRAVTLVEVIFAIGVILIGLLGLLSILPLAGKRSQDSISLSTGPQIANRVLAELKSNRFLSRNLVQSSNLLPRPDYIVPPENLLQPIYKRNLDGTLELDTDGKPIIIRWFTTPVCLDPILVSSPVTIDQQEQGYDVGKFPYLNKRYFPPSDPLTTTLETNRTQPRMYRFGIRDSQGVVPGTVARVFSENRDDLINTRPIDSSIPVRLSDGEITPISDGLEYGKRIPSGEFSWMVTVNPLPGGVYASVAVVVIRNRTLELEFPPAKNHVGERLVNVSYAMGFRGGAGGVAHLECSTDVDSSLVPGDWVMLSRNELISHTDGRPMINQRHHWYRVVGLDGDPQINGSAWTRKVLLDGPDWNFGYRANGTPDPSKDIDTYTYATIVSGVVCVKEAVLKLSEI